MEKTQKYATLILELETRGFTAREGYGFFVLTAERGLGTSRTYGFENGQTFVKLTTQEKMDLDEYSIDDICWFLTGGFL
jgi:hypothetical protein